MISYKRNRNIHDGLLKYDYQKLLRSVTFLVMPEGIQVEESFSTRGTHQPHPQMLSAHMCADCSTLG